MKRHRFLADMSELRSIYGPELPDILIVAGYAVPEDEVPRLIVEIEKAKEEICGDAHIPVKWNLKDVDRALRLMGLEGKKEAMLKCADELRGRLLAQLRSHGCTLFASAIQGYSNRRQVLGRTRRDLVRYSFTNILQRFGLFARGSEGGRLFLDWPEKNEHRPFTEEYLLAWRTGNGFMSGALRLHGFEAGVSFGVTDVDPLLQLGDLVVGMSRAFVRFAQSQLPESDFGVQQFRAAIPSFYANPKGRVQGWGFVVSPKDSTFAKLVSAAGARLKQRLA